jgi:hypothetical protein
MMLRLLAAVLLLTGVAVMVWRGLFAAGAARAWFQNRVFDPSAAELYAIDFWFNFAGALFGVMLAWIGRLLLRARE